MEEMYRTSMELAAEPELERLIASGLQHHHIHDRIMMMPPLSNTYAAAISSHTSTSTQEEEMKARIASHPRYPTLLQAYIDCHKVGAPPEMASLLDDIHWNSNEQWSSSSSSAAAAADPELDDFMEMYCDVLVKYRSELSRPFDEATTFLHNIQMQLSDMIRTTTKTKAAPPPSTITTFPLPSDEAAGSSDEEFSGGGEIEVQESLLKGENRDLKDKLLRKYSGYLSRLKQEFSKNKKKGKLPKEAREILLDWWTAHYKWPYPTEADKIALAESTGLDQKQINNWFINQRKRHWKPSENMQLALMDNLSAPFYDD